MPAAQAWSDAMDVHLSTLPFRLALFFAVNPDEWLSTIDISTKFDVADDHIRKRLRTAVSNGLFVVEPGKDGKGGRGNASVYRAGPELLRMVGGKLQREMIAACVPIRVRRLTVVEG